VRRRLLPVLVVCAVAASAPAAVALVGTARAGKSAGVARAAPAARRAPDPACPLPRAYRPSFEAAARATGLPLPLLVAVGTVESRLRSSARSPAGAEGLLQVLPSTAAELGLDASRARTNVLAGARYLRRMLDRFQAPDLALAAYNAGPSAVARAGGAPSGETLTYVANVTALWRSLVRCR
jgi:soluble lytic murein transglycosylase-like protein